MRFRLLAPPAAALSSALALAIPATAGPIQTVFVIAMENHNWTQPDNQFSGSQQQIKDNPNAPFINSLVNGTAAGISDQVAFTDTYHNVLATPSGLNPHIHPSEPSYLWAEAGTNFGVLNDNQPFGPGGTNQDTTQHLSGLLQSAGKTWKSYQEDIDIDKTNNTVLSPSQWVVPLTNSSGKFTSGTNAFDGSNQFDYAAKHDPMVFFTDTNGGNNATPSNPLAAHYAPLQQLATDLAGNTVAQYNWITPDQFNDMHTALTGGYTPLGGGPTLTGDDAKIRQGDDFLKQIVPMIMASDAYKNNGVIVLWWDESEGDKAGDNADDFAHTIPEIIISPDAHPNVGGKPYDSLVDYTHSADLRTMQEIFQVGPNFLGDAANGPDLSDLFAAGTIPGGIPEPGSLALLAGGLVGLARQRRRR